MRTAVTVATLFFAGFLFTGIPSMESMAATYYMDAASGNDANNGKATNAAWQTLAKINSTTFQPGDGILFKGGGSWTGTLAPLGSGTSGNPITINSYGTNAAMPIINGNGAGDSVLLTNQQYWEINNLEVINPGSGTSTERRGIHLCAGNFGVVNHLYVSNCFVHNIAGRVDTSNGDLAAKRTGGIVVEVITDTSVATRFNDISILNCTITSVTNQGIVACANRSETSDYPGTSSWNTHHCSALVVSGNVISDVGKNAMSIRYADESCVIQHNVVFNTANATDGNQIVSYSSRGDVFQYNEGYQNNGDGVADGSLYDADLRSPNTVWQYSYSHDNSWGLFVQYASSDTGGDDLNIVVRYNISRNDQGDIFAFSGATGATAGEYIYNNTVYTPTNLSPLLFDDRTAGHTYFAYNNVFYNMSSTAGFNFHSSNIKTFDYNVYYGQHVSGEPTETHKLTSDPKFAAPGTGTNGLSSLAGYKLLAGSPCIDSGLIITTNMTGNTNAGGLDFFGNPVAYNTVPDRGANEYVANPVTLPIISAPSASNVTASGVTLTAAINPGGAATAYSFQYGTNIAYGLTTATSNLSSGTNSIIVSNNIGGLIPGTLYHCRVVATNSAGTTNTSDATFTTKALVPPRLSGASNPAGNSFRLTFTNVPGAPFSVYSSTNAALPRVSWSLLGVATEGPPGQYQFTDSQATNNVLRFYEVRWP